MALKVEPSWIWIWTWTRNLVEAQVSECKSQFEYCIFLRNVNFTKLKCCITTPLILMRSWKCSYIQVRIWICMWQVRGSALTCVAVTEERQVRVLTLIFWAWIWICSSTWTEIWAWSTSEIWIKAWAKIETTVYFSNLHLQNSHADFLFRVCLELLSRSFRLLYILLHLHSHQSALAWNWTAKLVIHSASYRIGHQLYLHTPVFCFQSCLHLQLDPYHAKWLHPPKWSLWSKSSLEESCAACHLMPQQASSLQ